MQRLVRAALVVFVLLFVVLATRPLNAASLFDPLLRFRVLRTDHFRIYFHQGEDALAARLARIAEDTWHALERPLGVRPPLLTHVVLADQQELPNGYATPLPYDTIVMFPSWPMGSEFNVDDWLRLVFTHEFTHIVHLDRSESWARVLRHIFGRTIIAFPNLWLPTWQIEGLATYEESAITGEGRLHAGEFRAIVGEAARQRALEPLDRVNGGLTDWPGGAGPYAYGAAFHDYLAQRFGASALATLADATARRVPYTASKVFPRIFGASLGDLWRDFQAASMESAAVVPAKDDGAKRLTHHGFESVAPRFDRPACAGCPQNTVYYTLQSPDGFPSLNRVDVNGGESTHVTRRYLGTSTGIGQSALYFDQLEIQRNVGLSGDLYEWSRESGHVRRLTWNARLHDPDLSPDGIAIVCVRDAGDRRELVLMRLNANVPGRALSNLLSEPDTQFNAPRWSPDGRSIAVERHRLGSDPEIVVVDAATSSVRVAAARPQTRIVMPAWTPSGDALVAAVATGDEPFNLFEFPLADSGRSRQLTHTSGGATWPDVSQDGRTLLFVGYSPGGSDVFSMPYPPRDPTVVSNVSALPPAEPPREAPARPELDAGRYSPLSTLKPTTWDPVVEANSTQTRIGAATGGRDVLGYHAYAATATWLISAPADAQTPSAATPDWFVSYVYDRWTPSLFLAASSETSFLAGPATAAGTPSSATQRERLIEGGVILPILRTRVSHAGRLSAVRAVDDYTLPANSFSRDRTALRAAWQTITARTYGYSISREDGIAVGGTAEVVRRAFGASADATVTTGDLRAFVNGFGAHHVVALRAAGGRSTGDASVGRTFLLGGASSDSSVNDFGTGAISLLRGFPANSFAGSRVALFNAEYRWPIARPQRGVGTWPIFLHTLHAAAFADVGHAWTRQFAASDAKQSVGGELATNAIIGYYFPLTVAVGGAWGRDGSGTRPSGITVYVRAGRSF